MSIQLPKDTSEFNRSGTSYNDTDSYASTFEWDATRECRHEFYRHGYWILCKHCGLMYKDTDGTFPVDKINKLVKNPKTRN